MKESENCSAVASVLLDHQEKLPTWETLHHCSAFYTPAATNLRLHSLLTHLPGHWVLWGNKKPDLWLNLTPPDTKPDLEVNCSNRNQPHSF